MSLSSYAPDVTFQIETDRSGRVTAANSPARAFYKLEKLEELIYHISDVLPLRHKLAREEIINVYSKLNENESLHAAFQEGQSVSILGARIIWSYKPPIKAMRAWWQTMSDLPVAILLVSTDGKVQDLSRAAKEQLGDHEQSCVALMFEGMGRPILGWLAEVHENRATTHSEFVKRVGENQYYQLQVSPSPDPTLLLIFMHDITEMKQLEQQFLQSQKMQAVGQLAGGVAHDFNNLLTAIAGNCDLLLMRHGPDDPSHGDLTQIRHNTNRAAALVRQLLAFSRKQSLQPQRIVVQKTLDDLSLLLKTLIGERAQLSVTVAPDIKDLYSDPQQLEQCIINLVVNARDAIGKGGKIAITARNLVLFTPLERASATVPKGQYVEIMVEDNGHGIPEQILTDIFTPFFTTKSVGQGTGLGLSMVYGFVKQSGGYVFADSAPSGGARFTIIFPMHREAAPPIPMAKAAESALSRPFKAARVLLVEDDIPVRMFASRALQHAGHTIVEASNAEEALDTLRHTDDPFDLMVTDVIMPGTHDIAWVSAAFTLQPSLKVIFVSGYPEETFNTQRDALPHTWFLPKPYSLADLTDLVAQLHV